MSENRALAVLQILVHLSASLPDRYVLGAAEISEDLPVEVLDESRLPPNRALLIRASKMRPNGSATSRSRSSVRSFCPFRPW